MLYYLGHIFDYCNRDKPNQTTVTLTRYNFFCIKIISAKHSRDDMVVSQCQVPRSSLCLALLSSTPVCVPYHLR